MIPLREWDWITVSGYCLSEGRFFYRLKVLVATVQVDGLFKVWPKAERVGDGKLWFDRRHARIIAEK